MDPAAIYAITVIMTGIGAMPEIKIERLPPQWSLWDCIKDHERKLAGRPNTKALCVSWERFSNLVPPPRTFLVSIRSDGSAVDLTEWRDTPEACRALVARYADRVTAFCVEARRIETGGRRRYSGAERHKARFG